MEYQIQKAKRPLITTIENARHMISRAQNNLQQRPTAPVDIGNDPVCETVLFLSSFLAIYL